MVGQFDGIPHEHYESACWYKEHEGHTYYPCTAEQYAAENAYEPLQPVLEHMEREVHTPAKRKPAT